MIQSIALRRTGPPPAGTAGKIRAGRETREAVALGAGAPFARAARLPVAPVLEFGLAPPAALDVPVTVRAVLSGGGTRTVVFERTLKPGTAMDWQDVSIPLPADWSARRTTVTFELTDDGGESRTDGAAGPIVYCSNPRVVSQQRSRSPNVILISLDTVGARHLTLDGRGPTATPFLDRLAREGTAFTAAFANSSVTHVSHTSMLTGRLPTDRSFVLRDQAIADTPTLAQALHAQGYRTAAVTGGVLLTEGRGFDRGFESFFREDTLYRSPVGARTDVEIVVAQAERWLQASQGSPFFLFLHTYEAHGPYLEHGLEAGRDPWGAIELRHVRGERAIPESQLGDWVKVGVLSDTETHPVGDAATARRVLSVAEKRYDQEIERLDGQLAGLFDWLAARGRLDDTVVVVTADHGEAFFEHHLVEHGLLYDENLRVPLVFWSPGRVPAGQRIDRHVSSIDLAPTVLALLRVPAAGPMDGRSLLPLMRGRSEPPQRFFAFTPGNGFVWHLDDRYQYLSRAALEQPNFGLTELFDVRGDPLEAHDLLASGGTVPPALESYARETIAALPGLHATFTGLAGRTLDLRVSAPAAVAHKLYGFEFIPVAGWPPLTGGWRTVRFGSEPHLVSVESTPHDEIQLDLRVPGSTAVTHLVLPGVVPATRRQQLSGLPFEAGLILWTVPSEATNVRAVMTAEEQERLRALGYIR